jgi:hypothetical protein
MLNFTRWRKIYLTLVVAGVLLRVASTLIAGNRLTTPWRVGGDSEFYIRLASTAAKGMGLTYAGQPTAFRPPLYPLLLAGMMKLFGDEYRLATRFLQCAIGLTTVWLCWRTATRIFDEEAGAVTLLIALYIPTLAVFPTELMTECSATCLTAAFFYLALNNPHLLQRATIVYLALIVGFATLLRFNMAILGPLAVWVMVRSVGVRRAMRKIVVLSVLAGAIILPWIVRNEIVFHGRVLFSTQGGYNALQGVLTPQGRVQLGDLDTLRQAGAWLSGELETDGSQRLKLASEPDLDQRAWELTRKTWFERTWRLLPLMVAKLGYFWLSTDQLFWTRSFPWKIRVARAAGVLLYWCLLGLMLVGWKRLRQQQPTTAGFLLTYAVLISLAHLPFIMTARHRISFAEPLLVILGGAGWTQLAKHRDWTGRSIRGTDGSKVLVIHANPESNPSLPPLSGPRWARS